VRRKTLLPIGLINNKNMIKLDINIDNSFDMENAPKSLADISLYSRMKRHTPQKIKEKLIAIFS
jgi:hypothetical protein